MTYRGERISKKRSRKSLLLISFLVAVNIYMVSIFFHGNDIAFRILSTMGHIASGVFFLAFLVWLRKKENPLERRFGSAKLVAMYLKIIRKYILASIAGMVLAIMILSQIFLMPPALEGIFFNSYFGSEYAESYEINVHDSYLLPNERTINISNYLDYIEIIHNVTNQNLKGSILYPKFFIDDVYLNFLRVNMSNLLGDNYYGNEGLLLKPLIPSTIESIEKLTGTTIKEVTKETSILLYPKWYNHITITDSIPVYYENYTAINASSARAITNFNISLSNSIALEFDRYRLLRGGFHLFVSPDLFQEFYNLSQTLYNPYDPFGTYFFFSRIGVISDLPQEMDINQLNTELETNALKLYNSLSFAISSPFDIYSPLKSELENLQEDLSFLRAMILFLLSPVIGIGLYLMYYSLTLVEQRKKKYVAIMKIRGTTEVEMKSMIVAEIISSTIIAVVVGMGLSIPWVLYLFNIDSIPLIGNNIYGSALNTTVKLPQEWYWQIPIIGLLLSFDINLSNLIRLSSLDLEEGFYPEEQSKPLWQKIHLDMILFTLGMIEYLMFKYFPFTEDTYAIAIFLLLLTPFAIIGFLFGSALLVARYFAPFIGKFSDILWIKRGNMFALATRNMRQNRFSSSKLVAFALFALMISYTYLIVPHTFVAAEQEYRYYRTGADIVISFATPLNSTTISNISTIDGVEGYTLVNHISSFSRFSSLQLLAVNSTNFADIAFWKDNYADADLHKLMDGLKKNNDTIIIQSQIVKNLKLIEKVKIPVPTQGGSQGNFVFRGGTFDYFPRLINFKLSEYDTTIYGVVDLGYIKSINMSTEISERNYIYLKLSSDANATLIEETLEQILPSGTSIENAKAGLNSEIDNFTKILMNTLTQSGVVVALLAITIASSYYAFITLSERRKEIGILRAIGMKRNQIFQLLLVETLMVLIIGIVLGILMGYILSDFILSLVFVDAFSVPPIQIYFPIDSMSSFTTLAIILSALSAVYPAHKIANSQTGSVLRAE